MKKVLLSFLFVGILTSFSFALTRAYFTDKESVKGGKFSVGTLDLKVDGADDSGLTAFEINDLGTGTTSGSKSWLIKNVGSLPGILSLDLKNIVSSENGCNDPETQVDTTCANPGNGEGEVDQVITASFYLDGQLLSSSKLANSSNLLASLSSVPTLAPGAQIEFTMEWNAADFGNEIQSDSLSLDFDFSLKQVLN